jgi:hypothetical protein
MYTPCDTHLSSFCIIILSLSLHLIGELAHLLSVLGYEMHKCHKSVTQFLADWDAVLFHYLSVFHVIPCQFLLSHHPLNLSSIHSDHVCLPINISAELILHLFYSSFLRFVRQIGTDKPSG